jgi:SAM-dependent MidA family methyltransferase
MSDDKEASYAQLKKVIAEAKGKLKSASSDELGVLHEVGHKVRGQALAGGEDRLLQAAEELLDAIEDEIDSRGGEAWLEKESATSMNGITSEDASKMSVGEIMLQIKTCKAFERLTSTEEFKAAANGLVQRLEKELNARGLYLGPQQKSVRKYLVPTPSEIINGKSIGDVPNT